VQSMPITTKVVSSNSAHGEVHLMQHCVIRFSPVSSTNKTDLHNIAEILLKVQLNTITLTLKSLSGILKESFIRYNVFNV